MGPLMDVKVFNTNLIRFVLIFYNHINMNGIMMTSFHVKRAFFCSLGINVKPFPVRQYFDEIAG